MHSLVTLWQMPEEPWSALVPEILARIAPLIGSTPGVLEGYWTHEPATGKSVAFILLETADQAYDLRNALERLMESPGNHGIDLEMVRVQEVVARMALNGRPTEQLARI